MYSSCKVIETFLRKNNQRLIRIFLPPYSPNLSVLERIWKWLKESAISNRFHAPQKNIKSSVLSFLKHLFQFPKTP
ncbi:transposase [Bacillus toyonensis]|uniref:transposase n=1 Tax=Bacillus toyonensis TaxID=155322 RepID=UPI0034665C8C